MKIHRYITFSLLAIVMVGISCEGSDKTDSTPDIQEVTPVLYMPKGEVQDFGMDVAAISQHVHQKAADNDELQVLLSPEFNRPLDSLYEDLQVTGYFDEKDQSLHQLDVTHDVDDTWERKLQIFFNGDRPLYVEEVRSSADSNWNQYLYRYFYDVTGKPFAASWAEMTEDSLGAWHALEEVLAPSVDMYIDAFNMTGGFELSYLKKIEANNALFLQFQNPETHFLMTTRVDMPDDFTKTLVEGGDKYQDRKVVLEVTRFTEGTFTFNKYLAGAFRKE